MSTTRSECQARSTSRFAGVTRIGFRVAVVAGFAGAAWLLSATAAEAAQAATTGLQATGSGANAPTDAETATGPTAPLTSSVISLVDGVGKGALSLLDPPSNGAGGTAVGSVTTARSISDVVLTPVKGVLTTARPIAGAASNLLSEVLAPTNAVLTGTVNATEEVSPQQAAPPVPRKAPDAVFGAATPQVAAEQPGGAAARNDAGTGSLDLVQTVSDVVAPLGLAEVVQPTLASVQPMIGIVDPVIAPLSGVLSSVTSVLCDVAVPVTTTLGSLTGPVTDVVLRSTVDAVASLAGPLVSGYLATGWLAPSVTAAQATPVETAGPVPVRVDTDTPDAALSTAGFRDLPRTGRSHASVDRNSLPVAPGPLPAVPGGATGSTPTTGSGSHEGGGGIAILSSPVVNGSAAARRVLTATDVALRRQLVEDPTVSPD